MRRREPALLYTVGATAHTIAELTEDLGAAGLFLYDHFDESEELRQVSVLERPELAKAIVDAALSATRSSQDGHGKHSHVLVIDQIDDLGRDDLERTAVVGAIQNMGCEIRAGGTSLPHRWYQDQVRRLGFPTVYALMQTLTDPDRYKETLSSWWAEVGIEGWIPSETGRHAPTMQRVRELVDDELLSLTAAAERLMSEGYPNDLGNPVWYPANVRRTYEAGR